jgi:hypothetical protein
VQAPVGLLGAVAGGRVGCVLAAAQLGADPVRWTMVPGGFDQQSSGVFVAGLSLRSSVGQAHRKIANWSGRSSVPARPHLEAVGARNSAPSC